MASNTIDRKRNPLERLADSFRGDIDLRLSDFYRWAGAFQEWLDDALVQLTEETSRETYAMRNATANTGVSTAIIHDLGTPPPGTAWIIKGIGAFAVGTSIAATISLDDPNCGIASRVWAGNNAGGSVYDGGIDMYVPENRHLFVSTLAGVVGSDVAVTIQFKQLTREANDA